VRKNTLFTFPIKGQKTVQYWLFATFDACVAFFLLGIVTLLAFMTAVIPIT